MRKALLGLVAIWGLFSSEAGRAADGQADLSFSNDGTANVLFNLGGDFEDRGMAVTILRDGKIVLVGSAEFESDPLSGNPNDTDFAIARFNPSGALDTTFDTDGKRSVPFDLGGTGRLRDSATSVLPEAGGGVTVCGSAEIPILGFDPVLTRLTSAGAIDTTVGPPATPGRVRLLPNSTFDVLICVLTRLRSGAILATLGVEGYDAPTRLARLLPSTLALDTTFDGDGYAEEGLCGSGAFDYCQFRQTVELPTGKLLSVGWSQQGSALENATVVRFNTDGTRDTSFGTNGVVVLDPPGGSPGVLERVRGVGLQRDGRPVLLVDSGGTSYLTRLNGAAVDTTFGVGGWRSANVSGSTFPVVAERIWIQSDDRILLAGEDPGPLGLGGNIKVWRWDRQAAALDASFGSGGVQTVWLGQDPLAAPVLESMAAPDGRILVVGTAYIQTDDDLGVARLTNALVFDDGFEVGSTFFWPGVRP